MRTAFLCVVMCVVGAVGGCQTGSGSAPGEDGILAAAEGVDMVSSAPIETTSATLVVHGMGCPLCASNVDLQLKRVKGVEDVNVDMSSGRVKVALAQSEGNRPSRAQLSEAIKDSGFTLVGIETP